MNERIKELAEQAGFLQFTSGRFSEQAVVEKFAQLIIRDCLERIPDDCQSLNGCHLSWTLKDHFGIDQ